MFPVTDVDTDSQAPPEPIPHAFTVPSHNGRAQQVPPGLLDTRSDPVYEDPILMV